MQEPLPNLAPSTVAHTLCKAPWEAPKLSALPLCWRTSTTPPLRRLQVTGSHLHMATTGTFSEVYRVVVESPWKNKPGNT